MNKSSINVLLAALALCGFATNSWAQKVLNTMGNHRGLETCMVKSSDDGGLRVECTPSGTVIEPVFARSVATTTTPPWLQFSNYLGQVADPCPKLQASLDADMPTLARRSMPGSQTRTIYCHGTSCIEKGHELYTY